MGIGSGWGLKTEGGHFDGWTHGTEKVKPELLMLEFTRIEKLSAIEQERSCLFFQIRLIADSIQRSRVNHHE